MISSRILARRELTIGSVPRQCEKRCKPAAYFSLRILAMRTGSVPYSVMLYLKLVFLVEAEGAMKGQRSEELLSSLSASRPQARCLTSDFYFPAGTHTLSAAATSAFANWVAMLIRWRPAFFPGAA